MGYSAMLRIVAMAYSARSRIVDVASPVGLRSVGAAKCPLSQNLPSFSREEGLGLDIPCCTSWLPNP
jgi:hypothetical protein